MDRDNVGGQLVSVHIIRRPNRDGNSWSWNHEHQPSVKCVSSEVIAFAAAKVIDHHRCLGRKIFRKLMCHSSPLRAVAVRLATHSSKRFVPPFGSLRHLEIPDRFGVRPTLSCGFSGHQGDGGLPHPLDSELKFSV
jgi:hypothetical protein